MKIYNNLAYRFDCSQHLLYTLNSTLCFTMARHKCYNTLSKLVIINYTCILCTVIERNDPASFLLIPGYEAYIQTFLSSKSD